MKTRWIYVATACLMWTGLTLAQDPDPEPAKPKQSAPNMLDQAGATAGSETDPRHGRGKIFAKEAKWDFGHVAQNTRVTHRFFIENVGDDTLFITRIKPT